MTLLGIDPGYDRVGWAILVPNPKKAQIVASGCIETRKKDTIFQRYQQIDTELSAILKQHQPSECGIEKLFYEKNAKTAMQVSEARGIIISCLFRHNVEVFDYTPLQIKSAVTGNGHSNKQEVKKMVQLLTICEKLPKLDDEVDAIAAALCHSVSRSVRKLTIR